MDAEEHVSNYGENCSGGSSCSGQSCDGISRISCTSSSGQDAPPQQQAEAASPEPTEHVPPELCCPISQTLMQDPVRLSSGAVYDCDSISAWFALGHTTCPLTRLPVQPYKWTHDDELRLRAQDWMRQHYTDTQTLELQDKPLEVAAGHFLLPAPAACGSGSPSTTRRYMEEGAPTSPSPTRRSMEGGDASAVLSRQLESLSRCLHLFGADGDTQLACLQQLLALAAHSEAARSQAAAYDIVPLLLRLLLAPPAAVKGCSGPGAEIREDVSWYAAELLSYLSLAPSVACELNDMLLQHVPWLRRKMRLARGCSRAVRSLIKRLASPDTSVVRSAAWMLWLLSLSRTMRERMVSSRVVAALSSVLTRHGACNGSRVAAARVLRSVAMEEDSVPLLAKGKSVQVLLTALCGPLEEDGLLLRQGQQQQHWHHPHSSSCSSSSGSSSGGSSSFQQHRQDLEFGFGSLLGSSSSGSCSSAAMAAAMEEGEAGGACCAECCCGGGAEEGPVRSSQLASAAAASALSNVVLNGSSKHVLSSEACARALTGARALLASSSDGLVQRIAARLMRALACHPPPCGLGAQAGACARTLLRLLRPDNSACLEEAGSALVALCSAAPGLREAAAVAGGVAAASRLLAASATAQPAAQGARLRRMSGVLLSELACAATVPLYLTPDRGGVPPVRRALSLVCDSSEARELQGLSAVLCVLQHAPSYACAFYVDDQALLSSLVKLVTCHKPELAAAAAALLRRAAAVEANHGMIAKAGGVDAMLDVLRRAPAAEGGSPPFGPRPAGRGDNGEQPPAGGGDNGEIAEDEVQGLAPVPLPPRGVAGCVGRRLWRNSSQEVLGALKELARANNCIREEILGACQQQQPALGHPQSSHLSALLCSL